MHPVMREDALAARRREMLRGADHRLQLSEARATNGHHGVVDRNARFRIWLLHQLTWPRWPRAAMDEA
jgi:hypothetical protein